MNLYDEIIAKMDPNLNELEKARYIYIELGKRVSFSTAYNNTDDRKRGTMFFEQVSIYNLKTDEIICRTWAQLYSQLLDSVGIRNNIVDRGHQHVEFFVNGIKYIADATREEMDSRYTDLARIKYNDKTWYFGYATIQGESKSNNIRADKEEEIGLDEIDEKIGYENEKQKYLERLKEELKTIREETPPAKNEEEMIKLIDIKLQYLFKVLGKLENGYYEAKDFVYQMEKRILTEEELKMVGAVELKRTKYNGQVDIVQCIYIKPGENYYLLAPNMEVKKYEKEEVKKIMNCGYSIEDSSVPGITFKKHFLPGERLNLIKYKLCKKRESKIMN